VLLSRSRSSSGACTIDVALPKVSPRTRFFRVIPFTLRLLNFERCNLKKLAAFCLLLVVALPARAVGDGQVVYVGGTIQGLRAGVLGRLDASSQTALSFEFGGKKLLIPYAKIDCFGYSQRAAHNLGVLPAIAIALVRARQMKHSFRISFRDENNAPQMAIFEVPKSMSETLRAVLLTRSSQICKPQSAGQNVRY